MDFDPDRLGDLNDGSKLIWKDGRTSLGGRVVLMTTLLLLNYTASATRISVDGTFFVCPGLWEQLFILGKGSIITNTNLLKISAIFYI